MPLGLGIGISPVLGGAAAAAAGFSGLIDVLGVSAVRAYSMRRLSSAYVANKAIRIRRSSDNAELDIGFDGSGNLDTAAITAFVGANSAFVAKFYDQSGNADDLLQPTTAKQPRIVNSGTLDTKNTKPVLVFDGIDDVMAGVSTVTPLEISAVLSTTKTPDWSGTDSGFLSGTGSFEMGFCSDQTTSVQWFNNASFTLANYAVNNGTNTVVFGGVLFQTSAHASSIAAAWAVPQIGNDRSIASRNWPGTAGEVLLYTPELSAGNRTVQYNNQKSYWGTP